MTIPTSNFPTNIDNDENLFLVHDSLRLRLAQAYEPGNTSIIVEGDINVYRKFPTSGFITLTEQCSEIDKRALTFFYSSKTTIDVANNLFAFESLELLEGFEDVEKPERITNITQNVMAIHRNNLVDAIMAIERFVGVKGTLDKEAFGNTMEGRINYLHSLVLQPKAWFTMEKTIGLVPLTVTFEEQCFTGGKCPASPIVFEWNFGDSDMSILSFMSCVSYTSYISYPSAISYISQISCSEVDYPLSVISASSLVPSLETHVSVIDTDGGKITKIYTKPGKYDVSLRVTNKYGEDVITFAGVINARIAAPDEAVINIDERSGQIVTPGDPIGGPFIDPPKIRTPVDTFIDFTISEGLNPSTISDLLPFGRSYAGEELNSDEEPIDPIIDWSWKLGDDLIHANARNARASYSVGGLYDLILRTDTAFGSFRVTQYENVIDVVEKNNLWLWKFSSGSNVVAYEFGLLSETFKVSKTSLTVARNSSFLNSENNSTQAIQEFNRNVFVTPASNNSSGLGGSAYLYWASGRSTSANPSAELIYVREFNGFNETYLIPAANPTISRPWNWVPFKINSKTYFLFGRTTSTSITPFTSPTNQAKTIHDSNSLAVDTSTIASSDYKGGADELTQNISSYDANGLPVFGHFSVYRSATKDSTAYIARNDGVGTFFRIKSFYRTEGNFANPVQSIRKMPDIAGTTKLEGQMVPLSQGIFFFNNSSQVSMFDDLGGLWRTTSQNPDAAAFSSLQDKTVDGFSSLGQTLLAASDTDKRAYLSFDYSSNAFMKYNESTGTFSKLIARPEGEQWAMIIY